jgi:stress response protein YsnF
MGERPARKETIPLAEERIEADTREVERSRVVVRTHTEEREELVEVALRQEDVIVERVPRDVPSKPHRRYARRMAC